MSPACTVQQLDPTCNLNQLGKPASNQHCRIRTVGVEDYLLIPADVLGLLPPTNHSPACETVESESNLDWLEWGGGQDGQIITLTIRKQHLHKTRRLSPTSFNPSPTRLPSCIQHFDSSNGKLLKACLVLFVFHRRLNWMTVPCFIFQVVQVVASGVLGNGCWLLGLARRTGHETDS